MADEHERWDAMLLDLHLGQLSESQAEALRQRIDTSPELARQSHALASMLSNLDAGRIPDPPADLSDRVCDFIERHTTVTRFIDARPAERPTEAIADRVTVLERLWAWRDRVAAAACIALFMILMMPGYWTNQRVSARRQCLMNVRQIADGMALYAAANQGFLPSAGYVPGGSWLPDADGQAAEAPNSRHAFQLMKDGHIRNVRVFVCPADRLGRPMLSEADLATLRDFPDRENNSYSFIFMNVPRGLRLEQLQQLQQGTQQGMVIVADRNPHFPGTRVGGAGFPVPPTGNSPFHESGAGQNAIFADGSGGWFTTPNIGVNGDDIYRLGDLDHYEGTETPRHETDTFLPP